MKFSFEYPKYRDELAGKIKEKRKESREEARQLLENEKETSRYQITKKATRINQGINRLVNDGYGNPDKRYERDEI
jgi:hypothetical protein